MATHYAYLTGQVTFESIKDVLKAIDEGNKNDDVENIVVVISSPGGKIYAGFALYDYICASKKPVDTLALGLCASAAVLVLQAGRKRLASKHSRLIVHPGSWSYRESGLSELERHVTQVNIDNDDLLRLTCQRSGVSLAKFKKMLDPIHYISAKEALDFGKNGLIDGVVDDQKHWKI